MAPPSPGTLSATPGVALEDPLLERAITLIEPRRRTAPVKIWAGFGAVVLAFILFVWTKWVTGPFFEQVEYGPSEPPTWMKAVLIGWQAVGVPVAGYLVYRLVIRPWRRERHIGVDGMIVAASTVLWFQDPLSGYFNHWFSYNAYMVNFGSWVNEVPGWLSQGEPGAMLSEPILWVGPMYVYVFIGVAVLGCWVMRTAAARWPGLSNVQLVGICLVFMFFVDVVLEGVVWMPLGILEYVGGHWSIFPEAYHKFPVHEAVFVSLTFTGTACLRYFKNDKGETIAERGIADLRTTNVRKHGLRFLAVVAATQLIVFVGYNFGSALFAAHSTEWNADFQSRSYFTNHICGAETTYACPSESLPNPRDGKFTHVGPNGEIYGPSGRLIAPAGTVPGVKVVPFDRGATPGPFNGPLF